jgi:hypothetical protein
MRNRFILFILFLIPTIGKASVDDSLPQGVASRLLVFPFILRSPETKWGFGAAGAFFFKTDNKEENLRTSDINIVSLYTLRKQLVIVLGSTVFFSGEKKIFRGQASYSYYPDKFWGLGNDSPDSLKSNYSLKQFFLNPQFIIKTYKKLFIGASIELQNVSDFSYNSGNVFDTQNIFGKNGGFTAGVGILFTLDTRNNAYSPSKGEFAELNITRFTKALGSDFDFTSYAFDLRRFYPLGKDRVIGFQGFSKFNLGNTPIRNLSMLGGNEIMRGYYKGRYADRNMIAFQAELRQHLFWRFGLAAFISTGQVSNKINEFGLNDFHLAGGGGLRIMLQKREKLNLRVDVGFAENSTGVYVIMKEAF